MGRLGEGATNRMSVRGSPPAESEGVAVTWARIKKSGKFIHCPWCKGTNILQTDYEEEDPYNEGEYVEDVEGRACGDCNWEGSDDELVCVDDD